MCNEKNLMILISIAILILAFTWGFNAVLKIGNYDVRGVKDVGKVVADKGGWYRRYIFVDLSTIASNDEYGTFVFKKNGKFFYFPAEKNVLYDNSKNVYKYVGYWYYNFYDMRLTVTRTHFARKFFNVSFKDKEFFCSFTYESFLHGNSGDMTFNDDLIIENQKFKLLDNEFTKNSKEKLRLGDDVIDKYLELEKSGKEK
ncbi:MAG: hypothetical protein WBJ13_01615 [Sedimentibacter sp.]